jgi:hypothetical protein
MSDEIIFDWAKFLTKHKIGGAFATTRVSYEGIKNQILSRYLNNDCTECGMNGTECCTRCNICENFISTIPKPEDKISTLIVQGSAFDKINEIFNSGAYSDYTIHHNENKYPVHKFILIINSEYFASKFNGNWTNTEKKSDFPPETEDKIIQYILEYMYLRILPKLQDQISSIYESFNTIIKMRMVAIYLGMKDLIENLEEKLLSFKLTKENIDVYLEDEVLMISREQDILNYVKNEPDKIEEIVDNYPQLAKRLLFLSVK